MHIGRSEAVDGLLRITNHRQRAARFRTLFIVVDEERTEDSPLNIVRVLKLIDQRVTHFCAYRGAYLLIAHKLSERGDHVVKVDAA